MEFSHHLVALGENQVTQLFDARINLGVKTVHPAMC